jgi:ESS family glutamate:Na+ symporter
MLQLDLVQSVAFAGLVLFLGYGLKKLIPLLSRYNLPAPVIGGLVAAVGLLLAHNQGHTLVAFDKTLQSPLMIAFFASIGFGASLSLLKVGGPQVLIFFLFATVLAVAQNLLGVLLAWPLGVHPLFGVLAGSVTLTGGPATGLAFAPLFEEAGVPAAATVATAAAMVGIISGGVIGGPIGTWLIEKYRLRARSKAVVETGHPMAEIVEEQMHERPAQPPTGEDKESYVLLKSLVALLVALWAGSYVSQGFEAIGVTLPAYIGAMLVAALLRNLDDVTRWFGFSQKVIDDLGNAALSLFIVMALMSLELWKLVDLALPLVVILLAQVALIALVCWPVYRLMGRDYDAAVMGSGMAGFMLGTTANAMANMDALVEKYGPAPRAYLVVPMVGAFFIDFTNALIITGFLNVLK